MLRNSGFRPEAKRNDFLAIRPKDLGQNYPQGQWRPDAVAWTCRNSRPRAIILFLGARKGLGQSPLVIQFCRIDWVKGSGAKCCAGY